MENVNQPGANQPEELTATNDRALRKLARSITHSQANFALILVRCNHRGLRDEMVHRLKDLCQPITLTEVSLPSSVKTLYTTLRNELEPTLADALVTDRSLPPKALLVFGLDAVAAVDQVLISTNQVREEFRAHFPFPLVLWINDALLQKWIQLAPDFKSWAATPIKFETNPEQILQEVESAIADVFAALLQLGAGRFQASPDSPLSHAERQFQELEPALEEIRNRIPANPLSLEASIQFLKGRQADLQNHKPQAKQAYERSLALWQQFLLTPLPITDPPLPIPNPPLPITPLPLACVQFHLGLWWRQFATQHQADCTHACLQAKEYYQQCIQTLQTAQRPDLAARFINAVGEVQMRLIQQESLEQPLDPQTTESLRQARPSLATLWRELEQIAQTTVQLHEAADSHPIRRAYGYALQAELALHQSQATEAKRLAELALHTNDQPLADIENVSDWQVEQRQYRGLYLLLLAQAQRLLGQTEAAITNLETARTTSDPQFNPLLYIRILATLHDVYFDQGQEIQGQGTPSPTTPDQADNRAAQSALDLGQEPTSPYWQAFLCKQEQRSIEQQYGLRAFVGAGRLQPRRAVLNPALGAVEQADSVSQEMAASGRMQDINRLVERIGRADHKLTVIYGQSGVGKSSLVQAGLIPVLKQQMVEARDVLPVLLQVYSDWEKKLGGCYAESMAEMGRLQLSGLVDSMQTVTAELRQNADRNLLTVLIFDQFEEFFFAYRDPLQRRPFFEFLRDCLNIPYVKIILSLREDYLHYLLECNRLTHLDAIENNILDKKILYYLGNFSPADAQSVITRLIATSQLHLEPDLVTALVEDLAGELGEVRPIELQVVGAQLQTEKISTLRQYRERGPKEALVGRFLEEVVQDCGPENDSFTKIILYLLTDENNTRPLKTQAELESDLSLAPERFQLILNILVKSGLVFQIPGFPTVRYQLVHDYLVPFIRQQQAATLVAELEKEREQRKLTEAKLNEALKKQLKTARRATWTLAGLVGAVGLGALAASLYGIHFYLTNLSLESGKEKQLDQLVAALKAGKGLQQFSAGVIPETQMRIITDLSQAVNGVKELSRLQGHTASVIQVLFSPNGQYIATISEDNTAKLWNLEGHELATLKHRIGEVTSVSFSPDEKAVVSGSNDGMVRLWNIDGSLIKSFKAHQEAVTSLNFSPDGKLLATASRDHTAKLWHVDGRLFGVLAGHSKALTTVVFNASGTKLATSAEDDTIKIWNLAGQVLTTMENYGAIRLKFNRYKPLLVATNENSTIDFFDINDGVLLKKINRESYYPSISRLAPDGNILAVKFSMQTPDIIVSSTTLEKSFLALWSSHIGDITDLEFSPDSQLLATASKDKTVKLWRVQIPRSFNNRHEEARTVKFSPTDNHLLAVGYDNQVQFQDRAGKHLHTIQADGSLLNFSPDGQAIVAGSADQRLKMWRVDGQEVLCQKLQGHVTDMSLSPDAQVAAGIQDNGTVTLWNRQGQRLRALKAKQGKITKVQFSPNSQTLVSITDGNRMQLWQRNGRLIRDLPGHLNQIVAVEFSPDSQMVTSRGDDNVVNLWRQDGHGPKELKQHPYGVASVEFSPDSRMIAVLSNSGNTFRQSFTANLIQLWNRDGAKLATIDSYGMVSVQFSPDGKLLATIHRDHTIKLWYSHDGRLLRTFKGHHDTIRTLSFSPNSQTLASASDDHSIRLWQITRDRPSRILQGHQTGVRSIHFSPDQKRLVSSGKDNQVILWNLTTQKSTELQAANQEESDYSDDSPNKVGFSHDSSHIWFYGQLGKTAIYQVKFWNFQGKLVKAFDEVNTPSIGEDGKSVSFVENQHSFKLWNLKGALLSTFSGHRQRINSISFSSDGQMLASASNDKTIQLWKRDGTLVRNLTGHSDKVNSVSFNPVTSLIASGSDDKTVRLWQPDGKLLETLTSHTDKVNSVTFSPNGKTLASVDQNAAIRWNLDGKLQETIKLQSERGNRLLFSPNGTVLAIADYGLKLHLPNRIWFDGGWLNSRWFKVADMSFSPDNKAIAILTGNGVSIWSLDADELMKQGCNYARGYLNNRDKESRDKYRHLCDDIKPKP